MLKKFDEENLSNDHLFFPTSPKKQSKDQSPLLDCRSGGGGGGGVGGGGGGGDGLLDYYTDSDMSTTSTSTLPVYPTDVRNLSGNRGNLSGNRARGMGSLRKDRGTEKGGGNYLSYEEGFNNDPFDDVERSKYL